ncbi:hypothetical protein TNCV_2130091 [Trichonephila clavipes]|nr:hypothetical protein TNCV_2130091 [Trichonephila clavipes]
MDTHHRDVSAFSRIAPHATFSIKLLFIPLISLLTMVTSVQEESDPADDETDIVEDNNNKETSKSLSNADSYRVVRTTIRVMSNTTTDAQENQTPCN